VSAALVVSVGTSRDCFRTSVGHRERRWSRQTKFFNRNRRFAVAGTQSGCDAVKIGQFGAKRSWIALLDRSA
jgi:hypothetical protein